MDDGLLLLLCLVWLVGWILGIVGFFRARAARREVAELRRSLEQRTIPEVTPAAAAPSETVAPASATLTSAPAATGPGLSPPGTESLPETETPEQPGPAPEPVPAARRLDLEALLAMRWGVWLGAVALVLAGVFLVRYAVDQGLLGPGPRCVMAGLLGVALVAGAEWLRRREMGQAGIADQAAPALAAAGVAVLFGAGYGAGVLYALVPPVVGFALLAAASLAGLALSLRHGQLVAAVGLVGAFVTPALVQTDNPSLPGLFAYLLFVTAAALAVVRYTARVWLGWGSTIAGAVWVLLAIAGGVGSDGWAPGLFVPATAALNLGLLPAAALDHQAGRRLAWIPIAALGAAGLLLATLEPGWATRAGVLLLTPLTIAKAAREERLGLLPFLAAALFLLLLAGWSVNVQAWPPASLWHEPWPPGVVRDLEQTAAFIAGIFAASGLWFERRTTRPLPWASLAAAIPVLALAVCYARVAQFSPRAGWGAFALLLAAGLSGAAAAALRLQAPEAAPRADARMRAGVHAAGAVAAVALGCAMMLQEHWLTLSLSLFLPLLALVEAQVDLPGLRKVALAVAAVVLIRLLLNWYVAEYVFDGLPAAGGLLLAYGVPAAAFAGAAVMFGRRYDDLTIGVLEAGSVAFVTALVALEIRNAAGVGIATPEVGFAEVASDVASLAVLAVATMHIATRLDRPVLHWAWRILGGVAMAGSVLLMLANPMLTGAPAGRFPIINWLLAAWLAPAGLAVLAIRMPATERPVRLRRMLAGYAVLAVFVWISMEVRNLFHPGQMSIWAPVVDAELWAWSGAWLAYGAALMAIGIRSGAKPLRLTALAIVALTAAKVFLLDMSGLTGLWRVVSFLGLGLTLIGLSAIYRRFVAAPEPAEETGLH